MVVVIVGDGGTEQCSFADTLDRTQGRGCLVQVAVGGGAAVEGMVRGLHINGGEGDYGDNSFDLLTVRDQDLPTIRLRPSNALPANSKVRGTVKLFNAKKSLSFVTLNNGNNYLFVHHSVVHAKGFHLLGEVMPWSLRWW